MAALRIAACLVLMLLAAGPAHAFSWFPRTDRMQAEKARVVVVGKVRRVLDDRVRIAVERYVVGADTGRYVEASAPPAALRRLRSGTRVLAFGPYRDERAIDPYAHPRTWLDPPPPPPPAPPPFFRVLTDDFDGKPVPEVVVARAFLRERELPSSDARRGERKRRDRLLLQGLEAPNPYERARAARRTCHQPHLRPLAPEIERRVAALAVCGDGELPLAVADALACAAPVTRLAATLRLLRCPSEALATRAYRLAVPDGCPPDRRELATLAPAEREVAVDRMEACVREVLPVIERLPPPAPPRSPAPFVVRLAEREVVVVGRVEEILENETWIVVERRLAGETPDRLPVQPNRRLAPGEPVIAAGSSASGRPRVLPEDYLDDDPVPMEAVIRAVARARELPPPDGDVGRRDRMLLEGLNAPSRYEWYWALRELCRNGRRLSPALERRADTLAVCGDSHLPDAAAAALACAAPKTRARAVLRLLRCPEVPLQARAVTLARQDRCPPGGGPRLEDVPLSDRAELLGRIGKCVREHLRAPASHER